MKKTFLKGALFTALGLALAASNAMALSVGLDTGFPVANTDPMFTADDLDNNGVVMLSQAVGGFLVNAVTGTNPNTIFGTNGADNLDLLSVNISGGVGDVWVFLSEVNLNPSPAGWSFSFGGTTTGSIEFYFAQDADNTEWSALTTPFATVGSGAYGPGAFSGTFALNGGPSAAYSASIYARITHKGTGPQLTSFDIHGTEVPEPVTMLLFGAGLTCLAGVSGRKKG